MAASSPTALEIVRFIKGDAEHLSAQTLKHPQTLTYAGKYKAFYEFHEPVSDALEEIMLSKLIKLFHLCGSMQLLGFFQRCSLGYLLLTLFCSKLQKC